MCLHSRGIYWITTIRCSSLYLYSRLCRSDLLLSLTCDPSVYMQTTGLLHLFVISSLPLWLRRIQRDIETIFAQTQTKDKKSFSTVTETLCVCVLGREPSMICGNPLLCSIHVPHSLPLLFLSKLFGPMNCLLFLSKLFGPMNCLLFLSKLFGGRFHTN